MVNNPLISVVVPTHKRPIFLRKTLDSILKQTYQNIEVLVISNGVDENTRRLIYEIVDPRIKFFEQENSGGPASPRNHGIRKAQGKYVAFCDDDDLWESTKLEKQVEVLEERLDYGLCYSKMLRFEEGKEWSIPHEEGQANLHSLLYVNTVPISSVIVRKDLVLELGGFNESKIVGSSEDYEFLLRYSTKTLFFYIDEYLIKYWSGRGRTSSSNSERTIKDCLLSLRNVLGCYWVFSNTHSISKQIFIKPLLFHIKETIKSIAYIFYKKLT